MTYPASRFYCTAVLVLQQVANTNRYFFKYKSDITFWRGRHTNFKLQNECAFMSWWWYWSLCFHCAYNQEFFLPVPLQVHRAGSCHLCFCEWHFKYDTLGWQYTPWAVTSPGERWHHRLQWQTSEAYLHMARAVHSWARNHSVLVSPWGMCRNVGHFLWETDRLNPESECKCRLLTMKSEGLKGRNGWHAFGIFMFP